MNDAKHQAYIAFFVALLGDNKQLIEMAALKAAELQLDQNKCKPLVEQFKAVLPQIQERVQSEPELMSDFRQMRYLVHVYDSRQVTVPAAIAAIQIASQKLAAQ